MSKTINKPKKGVVLLAEPFMKDPYFKRSVVLLADHNEKGSMGFMLNKAIELNISETIIDFPDFEGTIYLGGPIGDDQLFFIHTYGDIIPNSVEIINGLWWGGDFNTIKSLVNTKAIDISHIRFFVGYAGWDSDQLNKELKEGSWIITEQKPETILHEDTDNLWPNILKSLGGEYKLMATFPEDPSLN